MSAEFVAHRLGQAHLSSSGWWRCRCPAHGSRGSTLAIRDTASGIVLLCHGGCSHDTVWDELRRLGIFDGDERCRVTTDPAEIRRQRAQEERRWQQRIASALDRDLLTFWAACRAGEMAPSGLIGADTAAAVIANAAMLSGLPRAEAERSAWSGVRTGLESAQHA